MSCIHKGVCKHFPEDAQNCDITNVCKHYLSDKAEKIEKKKYHKRGLPITVAPTKKIADPDNKITRGMIGKARRNLTMRSIKGVLTDEQNGAFTALKDIPYDELNEVQREQIMDILKDTTQPRGRPKDVESNS